MKLFFTVVFLLLSLQSQALAIDFVGNNQKKVNCIQLYNTFLAAKNVSNNYGKAANDCKLACQRSTVGFDDPKVAAHYEACSGATSLGNAGSRCEANNSKVSDGNAYDNEVWTACATDCSQAISETTNTDLKKKYSTIVNLCNQKAASGSPVDPNGDMYEEDSSGGDTVAEDDATSGDGDAGGLDPADTGNPNNQALQSLMGSGLNNSNSRTPIDGGAVDFTGSGFGGGGSYADAAGTSGPVGFGGSNVLPAVVIDDNPELRDAGQNPGAGAGGGPMAGAGAPGMGGMGGMGGAAGGGASRPGGGGAGGPRTSIAGAQLGKVGQNVFWSGNGGGASGSSGASRKTATAIVVNTKDKKPMGPSYLNKGTGDAGLLRLFGARPLKLDGGQSQSCADNTVFCSHENYFLRVDRYPNSDINPNSGSK